MAGFDFSGSGTIETVYFATDHDLLCDGTTDDSAAFLALLTTVQAAGKGAEILFPGVARIDSQITFPNDGGAIPKQVPIRLSGQATHQPGAPTATTIISGGLDLRYAGRVDTGCSTTAGSSIVADPSAVADDLGSWVLNDNLPDRAIVLWVNPGVGYTLSHAAHTTAAAQSFTVALPKLLSLGMGTLELDHLFLTDGGTSSTSFGRSTNTTVKMRECRVVGNAAKSGASCDQDIWEFGGGADSVGVLSSALTNGVAYTSLPVEALTLAVASGTSMTLGIGTNTQTVTTSGAAAIGATSIPVTSFNANADYPARTAIRSGSLQVSGTPLGTFQGYGSTIEENHFERVRRILGTTDVGDTLIAHNKWMHNCGSNLAKTPSTLTTALVSGTTYTTLAVTALSQIYRAGDTVQIGVARGLGGFFQVVTVSADTAADATSLPVNSFAANAAYAVGSKVYNVSRGLGACIEGYSYGSRNGHFHIANNRVGLNVPYSYFTRFGQAWQVGDIAFNAMHDTHAATIAAHRFEVNAEYWTIIPSLIANTGIPLIDDASATSGGVVKHNVIDPRAGAPAQLQGGLYTAASIVSLEGGASPYGPRIRDSLGNDWYQRGLGTSSERLIFYRTPVGGANEANFELSRSHLVSLGTAPTVAVLAAAGSGATATLAGTDCAGTVTLTSGSASLAMGEQFQLSFNKTWLATPRGFVLTPANAAAAGLGTPYLSTQTTATFRLGVGVAPAASTEYKWNYVVIG